MDEITMVFTFLAEKYLTNFLASVPNFLFDVSFRHISLSPSCLHLNGSQFIPGFLFNLLISLSCEINFKHFLSMSSGCLRD